MTSIWYEVFPVTLVSKQVALIRHHREENFSPWMIPNLPNIHPNEIVVNHWLPFLMIYLIRVKRLFTQLLGAMKTKTTM